MTTAPHGSQPCMYSLGTNNKIIIIIGGPLCSINHNHPCHLVIGPNSKVKSPNVKIIQAACLSLIRPYNWRILIASKVCHVLTCKIFIYQSHMECWWCGRLWWVLAGGWDYKILHPQCLHLILKPCVLHVGPLIW